jgi:ATP adenylyltransferase
VEYERIWAPWRLGYIIGGKKTPPATSGEGILPGGDPTCFLCQDATEGDDGNRFILQRGPHTVTMLNRYPYNNGHLLVAPRRHLARLDQLESCEQLDLLQTMSQMVSSLERVLKPEGFNVGLNLGAAAGAGLPGHLHWHIVPRWPGDTNFMPVTAGIRVIPQSLEALWEALREDLRVNRSQCS